MQELFPFARAIDGSGLGEGLRVVGLLNVLRACPLWLNWRVRTGNESEKGKEASVVLEIVDEVRALAVCRRNHSFGISKRW